MSEQATVRVTTDVIGDVSPRLFGALTEHFGHGMYGGIWDVERDIPRADVKAAIRALGTTMFRYPGGCFADWYHWQDGVGPKGRRPVHEQTFWTGFRFDDLVDERVAQQFALPKETTQAFGPREANQVGTDEILQYCLDLEVEPMLVANFGTGSAEEAAAWVQYTNRGGAPRPVRRWSIGNETYGRWELGHCPPDDYATGFRDFAEAMRAVDPDIKLTAVGCGSPVVDGRAWNTGVVGAAADIIDALSVHWYFPGTWVGRELREDEADFLQLATGSHGLGEMLDGVIGHIAEVTDRPIPLSLDEWNLWLTLDDLLTTNARMCDAVFFAGCFNRLLERADRVREAAISHLVNCMAPIQTRGDRHFVTASYLVAQLYRWSVRRDAVRVQVESSEVTAPPFADVLVQPAEINDALAEVVSSGARTAAALDASSTCDDDGATVYLANRLLDRSQQVHVSGLPPGAAGRFRHLAAPSPFTRNTVDDPSAIGLRERAAGVDQNGACEVELPPHTVGALVVTR